MFADADHEVIDSPEALFRHLYEEHGVAEALDLDPGTAPVQFWLRRHAELERDQRSARHQPGPAPRPEPQPQPEARSQRPEPPSRSGSRPQPPSPPGPGGRGPARPDGGTGAREGRRHVAFGDPLLEAMTRALVGRGHDEAAVRAAIRSFPPTGGRPAGEAGVRSAFVEPMLQAVTEHLLAPGGPRHPGTAAAASTPPPTPARAPASPPAPPTGPPPTPARAPASPPAPAPTGPAPGPGEPARPEAAWAVLWADLVDTGRRADEGAGSPADEGDDLMAVANAVQARRRVRLLRR